MGVAKMRYVNVYGPEKMLNRTLSAIARCQIFAPEDEDPVQGGAGTNKYEPLLTKAKGLLTDLGASSLAADYNGPVNKYHYSQVSEFIEHHAADVAQRNKRITDVQNQLEVQGKTKALISRIADTDINFDDLFNVQYLKIRVGRLPKNGYVKLAYYAEQGFSFTEQYDFILYDFDGQYYWGLYFAPRDCIDEIDQIFSSLYFERLWVPDTVHGSPQDALKSIEERETDLRKELDELTPGGTLVSDEQLQTIQDMTAWLNHRSQIADMKKHALVISGSFYISGFVPEDQYKHFEDLIEEIDVVRIKKADPKEPVPAKPPVKLKNRWFSQPFEMFTEMYGLPGYREVDPTPIVAVFYSVLYGIMFADLGQGLVLGLVGYFLMYKKKKMAIGRILTRAAFFSCLFGLLFGSVFGYEHLLDPLYARIGLSFLPFHPMSADSIMTILISSLVIGVFILAFSITTSIVVKFREGQRGEAVTSPNGIAGLVFFLSVILMALDMVKGVLGNTTAKPFFILPLIVLPLLVMYMREPLAELIDGKKPHVESVSDLLVGGFFELFVTLLEFLSNTVSFLRVGGFVLAHAGMMTVVMTLAQMNSGPGQYVIVALGNIFVICLEGLIVGIQALRLNYYEVFSRFYDPDGAPFTPLAIRPDTVEL